MSYDNNAALPDRQGERAWRLFVLLLVVLACAPAVVVRMRIVAALDDFDAAVRRSTAPPASRGVIAPDRRGEALLAGNGAYLVTELERIER